MSFNKVGRSVLLAGAGNFVIVGDEPAKLLVGDEYIEARREFCTGSDVVWLKKVNFRRLCTISNPLGPTGKA